MEEKFSTLVVDGRITRIKFSLASHQEICTSSISECPITHPSQLTNPFLGLPLETGKCESCGTAEPGACDGHFGYIELPIPVYHPSHVGELKRLLSAICLKCLRLKKGKIGQNGATKKSLSVPCSYCLDMPPISIRESNAKDGAFCLELKLPKSKLRDGVWDFLDRYGFRYGYEECRTLLPCEVLEILRRISAETKKKLTAKGYFPQDGYIIQKLPVPPNCLSVPEITDGVSVMSSDLSVSMLKKVLKQSEIIKTSRSGPPNFESHEVEANELQSAIHQYFHFRGTTKAPQDVNTRFGISKENESSSTKAWLEKMKTLFISKGSGFSSRSVITGDVYKRVDEIGVPSEIAQRITFEEKVTVHNKAYLQDLVDKKLCLTYRDGGSTYSLREGSTGHTSLKVGQVVHRRIMDGDIIFINRPPSTHKHSLQAFSVYIHDDNTVKINPLICSPLGADFDGDCIHLFYPQSLAAKAEVLELFSVEHQLLSSHSGNLNLQLANDALLSLKIMLKKSFLDKATAQQLMMFLSTSGGIQQYPALVKANGAGAHWTGLQILQNVLPADLDCLGERYLISKSEIVKFDYNRDVVQSVFNDIINSVFFKKGSSEALKVFNSIQPLLMENIFVEGYSVSLEDFCIPEAITQTLQKNVQGISPLLCHLRSTYNEVVELQVENHLRSVKVPVANFILKSSALGNLIDSKSEGSINKVVQQIGFLGLQLFDRGRFYTRTLIEDMTSFFKKKFAVNGVDYPSEAFGLIKNGFFHGLNPYEKLVDSISSREVLVRSSRGLTEPGTLFKNLMAILRDVVICYDGTVRNVCSNTLIEFEYGEDAKTSPQIFSPAGEPVGVLAATAISNPAYKAVLDSSPSSNSSWELMKEILLCRVNYKNDLNDRRVILYLNDCECGKKYCKENAACSIQAHLKRRNLKDVADNFLVEYKRRASTDNVETDASLVGHIHLNKTRFKEVDLSMLQVLQKCQEKISSMPKKKDRLGRILKILSLSVSECCCFCANDNEWSESPCLQFSWPDTSDCSLEQTSQLMANTICSILLETIVKGDPRVYMANIMWVSPDTTTWVRRPSKVHKGELALEIVLEKDVVKKHGETWRIVLDSCLPVMHLIDTRRSIPYAIKQLHELVGVSCAFDQAVQRLATSIRMVAKGVLKEHLILVANSMTCTGNLLGFNTGGYKALFRSLNVQVPFTEATLFTPRKCFERAAEKCHTDSLSSTVASCSWGKRVAVGTGARFEILWNKKEMEMHKEDGLDIFNFLSLVRKTSNEGELISECLGEDIDDIEMHNGDFDRALSPEIPDCGKPTFDDGIEVEGNLEQNQTAEGNWGGGPSQAVESGAWGSSGAVASKPGAWSGWDSNDKVQQWDNNSSKASEEPSGSGGWNTMQSMKQQPPQDKLDDPWAKKASTTNNEGKAQVEASWGKQNGEDNTGSWNKSGDKSQWGQEKGSDNWGTNTAQEKVISPQASGGWGKQDKKTDTSGWNTSTNSGGWAKQDQKADTSDWGGGKSQWGQETDSGSWGKNTVQKKITSPETSGGWGKQDKKADTSGWNKSEGKSQWGQEQDAGNLGTVNTSTSSGGWAKQDQKADTSGWGGGKPQWGQETGSDSWGKNAVEKKIDSPETSGGWGKQDKKADTGGWGKSAVEKRINSPETSGGWGKQDKKADTSGWNKSGGKSQWGQEQDGGNLGTVNTSTSSGGWAKQDKKADTSGWGGGKSQWGQETGSDSWGKNAVQKVNSLETSGGWGKQDKKADTGGWNKSGGKSQWGQEQDSGWGTNAIQDTANPPTSSDGWGKQDQAANTSSWSKNGGSLQSGEEKDSDNWGKKANKPTSSSGWGSAGTSEWTNNEQPSQGEQQSELPIKSGSWDAIQVSQPVASQGWNSSGSEDQSKKENPWTPREEAPVKSHAWGTGRPAGSRRWGSGNDGDRKFNKNRPPTPQGKPDDQNSWNSNGLFTATRQRLDLFTSEEQSALTDVEPVMQSIRRIMNQYRETDGEPLSAEDQTYILDNVFKYHPEKAAKTGAGVDHVMISKHGTFQDTRCLYIVSTDGRKEDFSYRKCMENFVKERHPDVAETFTGKYFRKPRDREPGAMPATPATPATPMQERRMDE